eukprot:3936704-Rhodomonas_salina.2
MKTDRPSWIILCNSATTRWAGVHVRVGSRLHVEEAMGHAALEQPQSERNVAFSTSTGGGR